MDKSQLQKNLRSKLVQKIKHEAGNPANTGQSIETKTSVNNKAKPDDSGRQETSAKNTFTSKLEETIAKKVASTNNQNNHSVSEETNIASVDSVSKNEKVSSTVIQPQKAKRNTQRKISSKSLKSYLPLLSWYSFTILIILLDQITKSLASAELIDSSSPLILTSWLQFDLVYNPGAAFSIFADAGGWQRPFLVLVSLAVSIFIIVWMARLPSTLKMLPLALALVLGGAVGNLIDRAISGYVVDFIAFHYEQLFFPTFNIADASISCGAVLLLLDVIMTKEQPQHKKKTATNTSDNLSEPQPNHPQIGITAEELLKQADAKKTAATR